MMKNLLLSTVVLLAIGTSIAQVSVIPRSAIPNNGDDSYIYVNNTILFVTDEIDLTENPTDTIAASIYLRNGAQLIQGTGTDPNTGTGSISVIQDSRSDSYDYNFWGSPIGVPTSTGNQNFGMTRVKDSTSLIGSTVSYRSANHNAKGSGMGTPDSLVISNRWLYRREANTSWIPIGSSSTVAPGYGFIMKGTNVTTVVGDGTTISEDANNQRYDFQGRPNQGDIEVVTDSARVTLSGNPYPSALDLNRVFYDEDNSEIVQFRFWDEDRSINSHLYRENKGGYGSWIPGTNDPNGTDPGFYTQPVFLNYDNSGAPTGSTGVNGAMTQRRFAPIGQGYNIFADSTAVNGHGMVPADPSNDMIIYKDSHRRYITEGIANSSQFRDQDNNDVSASADINDDSTTVTNEEGHPVSQVPHIRLNTFFGESHFRDMILAFPSGATHGFDRGMDAIHPMDAVNGDCYFIIGEGDEQVNLVIESVPFVADETIPLTFTVNQQTKISMEVVEQINISETAYLFDKEKNVYHEMTSETSADVFLEAGLYENRFFITFVDSHKSQRDQVIVNQKEAVSNVDFFQNNSAGILEVKNPEGYDIANAAIYDLTGKLVHTDQNVGTSTNFSFPTGNLSDGVYLVKLTTVDNISIDYKTRVFNKK